MKTENDKVNISGEGVLMLGVISFPFAFVTLGLLAVFISLTVMENTWAKWLFLMLSIFDGLTFLCALFCCIFTIKAYRELSNLRKDKVELQK